jgi:ABC-type phosphate transport system permease subunit
VQINGRQEHIMGNLNAWRFGAVFALTVVISYAVCTLAWMAFTEQAVDFLNALFHGLDFRRLQVGGGFSAVAWLYATAVLTVWAFVTGALFAALRGWLARESSSN